MKSIGKAKAHGCIVALFTTLFLMVGTTGAVNAVEGAPVSAHVYFNKSAYNLDDPAEQISAVITLKNQSGANVYTSYGFGELGHHLYFFVKTPEGKIITSTSLTTTSPTPLAEPPKVKAELLNGNWVVNTTIDEFREYYDVTAAGDYTVYLSIPFVAYAAELVDPEPVGDHYLVPANAVAWQGELTSNTVYFSLTRSTPQVASDVRVRCQEFIFGEGVKPGVTKQPLVGFTVNLYKRSAIEDRGISPINFQTCNRIVTEVSYFKQAVTDTSGECGFGDIPQDDYVVVGIGAGITSYKHLWNPIDGTDPGWETGGLFKNLHLVTDYRGKKSPGKSKKLTGSELWVIEPEYVEWSGTDEYYPFAFESVGDWDVTVSLEPPEGFVADQVSLSEVVADDLKALQFLVTDEGSAWMDTKVKYKIKHKNKKYDFDSKIGVKLSRKLAKQKKKDVWGDGKEKGDKSKK